MERCGRTAGPPELPAGVFHENANAEWGREVGRSRVWVLVSDVPENRCILALDGVPFLSGFIPLF
jgi:hypothetical protein